MKTITMSMEMFEDAIYGMDCPDGCRIASRCHGKPMTVNSCKKEWLEAIKKDNEEKGIE